MSFMHYIPCVCYIRVLKDCGDWVICMQRQVLFYIRGCNLVSLCVCDWATADMWQKGGSRITRRHTHTRTNHIHSLGGHGNWRSVGVGIIWNLSVFSVEISLCDVSMSPLPSAPTCHCSMHMLVRCVCLLKSWRCVSFKFLALDPKTGSYLCPEKFVVTWKQNGRWEGRWSWYFA